MRLSKIIFIRMRNSLIHIKNRFFHVKNYSIFILEILGKDVYNVLKRIFFEK